MPGHKIVIFNIAAFHAVPQSDQDAKLIHKYTYPAPCCKEQDEEYYKVHTDIHAVIQFKDQSIIITMVGVLRSTITCVRFTAKRKFFALSTEFPGLLFPRELPPSYKLKTPAEEARIA